ncbi:hypothetical protein [Mesorhizobium sp. B2-5-7]|uniref:hypothetical protein n=1 Tax=Mesorhizobium sp. B2-5-7 TaxID=2589923 RepID=UPI00112A8A3E|nr:hypothetical protein [Mesorhizobium sp. B2-5-7]TPK10256.1 hypothetical protein FJ543_22270 [Mesorhizobium sp. B2-5-7]
MAEPNRRQPESRDVSARILLWSSAGFVVFLGVTLGVLALLFDTTPRQPPLGRAFEDNDRSPTLQRDGEDALGMLLAREKAQLEKTGWIDHKAGIARIPIEDAIQMIADKGVPEWMGRGSANSGECDLLNANVPRAPQARDCRNTDETAPGGSTPAAEAGSAAATGGAR